MGRLLLALLLVATAGSGVWSQNAHGDVTQSPLMPFNRTPDLPHTTLVVWDDDAWTIEKLAGLHSCGVQGLAKLVNASGWNVVEPHEGEFDFSRLESFLTRAQQARLWVLPTVGLNTPPDWFIAKYPSCLMKDARGNTVITTYTDDDGQILSPWFMAGRTGSIYIRRYVERLLAVLGKYPNVIGVFVGNEAAWLFNRPWRFGDSPELTCFSCFDDYALVAYRRDFGFKYPEYPTPPATYEEVTARGEAYKTDFEYWYQAAAVVALDKYLGWLDDRVKYKVVNVGKLGFPYHNYMLGTTDYQLARVFAMMARHRNVIESYEALDASEVVCHDVARMATGAGLVFGGEPVGGGNLPQALINLEDCNGELMVWVALEQSLVELAPQIRDFNSRFPPLPLPPKPAPT